MMFYGDHSLALSLRMLPRFDPSRIGVVGQRNVGRDRRGVGLGRIGRSGVEQLEGEGGTCVGGP